MKAEISLSLNITIPMPLPQMLLAYCAQQDLGILGANRPKSDPLDTGMSFRLEIGRSLVRVRPRYLSYIIIRRISPDGFAKNILISNTHNSHRISPDIFRFSENLVTVFLSYERNTVTFVAN